jgi:hypothetical protein
VHIRPLLPLLALIAIAGHLQADPQTGREFWFAWPETADVTGDDNQYDLDGQLILLAEDGPVAVSAQGPGLDTTVAIAPGSPAFLRLDRDLAMVTEEDTPVRKAFHLWTEDCGRFGVLFRVPGSGSSVGDDVMRVLPLGLLGTRYLPVSYFGQSEFLVVATEDGTGVSLDDRWCGVSGQHTMSRGEAVLHRCDLTAAGVHHDVTGSLVEASAPVAVICASAASQILSYPIPGGGGIAYWGYADILLESVSPVDLMGRTHAHPPFRREGDRAAGDLIRIVAACPETGVEAWEADGEAWLESLLEARDYVDLLELDLTPPPTGRLVNEAALISTGRPAEAASYTVGLMNAGIGDPSLSVLDPMERWERGALAYLPSTYDHSVAIVAPEPATGSVRMNGSLPPSDWRFLSDDPPLRWMRLDDLGEGEVRVTADEPIFVVVSGYAPQAAAGAYSYPAIAYRPGGPAGVRIAGTDPCALLCPGDCLDLEAPAGGLAYAWSTGGPGQGTTICPGASLEVSLEMTDGDGCLAEGWTSVEVAEADVEVEIEGPDEVCEGECVELRATAGFASYDWEHGATGEAVTVCPTASTTYRVTATEASFGCTGEAEHAVATYPPPAPGPAAAAPIDPCIRGIDLTWDEAAWRPGSPGGVYNVYRREGGCADPDDPSWELLATGLPGSPFRDDTTQTGVAYSYLVEAEDEPAPWPCRPGPWAGGPAAAACADPERVVDPGDPDLDLLVTLNPYLRATGCWKAVPPGTDLTVSFSWALAPDLDPRTYFEVWRADVPWALQPLDRGVRSTVWTDLAAGGPRLWFYKAYNATGCGSLGEWGPNP